MLFLIGHKSNAIDDVEIKKRARFFCIQFISLDKKLLQNNKRKD